MVSKVLIEK